MSAVAAPPRLGVAGDRAQSATRTVVAAFGLMVSLAGLEHGIGEILEGPIAPSGIVFRSWPDTAAFDILGGEPAMTIVPNLLATGSIAILVSIALAWWSVTAAHRPGGGRGLFVLSVLLLLGGGGLFPPVIGIVLAVAASRIGVAGRSPGSWVRPFASAWRPALVAGLAGYLGLFPGTVLASALFGVEEAWLVLVFGVLAFGGLFVALAGARAHDRLVIHATEDK